MSVEHTLPCLDNDGGRDRSFLAANPAACSIRAMHGEMRIAAQTWPLARVGRTGRHQAAVASKSRLKEETLCGRFTQHYTWAEVHAFLSIFGPPSNLQPRYNIAPTTMVDVVRLVDGHRALTKMRWGLVPFFWKKTLKEVPATFNARAETVAEKPMFRDAFKRGRRCIIPASGFYEWTGSKKERQPHLFTAADGSPVLAFAGLWDRWRDPASGEEVLSCTMIVSGASAWMEQYHDRIPVILTPDHFGPWHAGELGPEELQPAAENLLREWEVSLRVNRAGDGDDDPTVALPR